MDPIRKPPEGDPCNGCGVCCVAVPCPMAIQLLGADLFKPCPAIEWEGPLARCGLMQNPVRHVAIAHGLENSLMMKATSLLFGAKLAAQAKEIIGAGKGCCSTGRDGYTAADQFNSDALGVPDDYGI